MIQTVKTVLIPGGVLFLSHLIEESVARLIFATLIPIYRKKCLNYIKDEILLRRNPSDIPLRFIQNDNSNLCNTD